MNRAKIKRDDALKPSKLVSRPVAVVLRKPKDAADVPRVMAEYLAESGVLDAFALTMGTVKQGLDYLASGLAPRREHGVAAHYTLSLANLGPKTTAQRSEQDLATMSPAEVKQYLLDARNRLVEWERSAAQEEGEATDVSDMFS